MYVVRWSYHEENGCRAYGGHEKYATQREAEDYIATMSPFGGYRCRMEFQPWWR